ncbi:MAG TPA: polysaccharide biosynthesis/export family protein [Verrucomicrobiae bacterium]|jgi:polysaccharide export outer membrane protein|nr:polysaccharide biosynthesis/export family protein [Verrucomicrobiae bacterium]
MIEQLRKAAGVWLAVAGIISVGLLSGCQTGPKFPDLPPSAGNLFHIGDMVTVSFVSVGQGAEVMPAHSERIHEDGTITLSLIGPIVAAGKTAGDLQKEIHDRYVPRFYTDLNVTVHGEGTYFYVDGEVVQRGAKEYPGDMTIVKAISVAGGFTDFARRSKVRLTRGGHTETINVQKAISDPRYDVAVFPGDKIFVPRRLL